MKKIFIMLSIIVFASCGKNDKNARINTNNLFQAPDRSGYESVTKEYGFLSVKPGTYSYESDIKPWSSWWFPSREKFLFRSTKGLSPLEKYDKFVDRKYDKNSDSARYEEDVLYNPDTAAWAGLCHAWAIASVLHPEPKNMRRREKVEFSVADQKALMLKKYENVSGLKIYGDRYDGNHDDQHDDIYPDQLHKFMQVFLRDKKLPVLMDYDASYPVWTVPVYKARFQIKEQGPNELYVTAWITMASPFVGDPNFVGTKSVLKVYTYRLFGNYVGENFIATSSEWTEKSILDHPDYVIAYPDEAKPSTFNKEINMNYLDEVVGLK